MRTREAVLVVPFIGPGREGRRSDIRQGETGVALLGEEGGDCGNRGRRGGSMHSGWRRERALRPVGR
jgi:hypothetical protein